MTKWSVKTSFEELINKKGTYRISDVFLTFNVFLRKRSRMGDFVTSFRRIYNGGVPRNGIHCADATVYTSSFSFIYDILWFVCNAVTRVFDVQC